VVQHLQEEILVNSEERLTICPNTTREICGHLGLIEWHPTLTCLGGRNTCADTHSMVLILVNSTVESMNNSMRNGGLNMKEDRTLSVMTTTIKKALKRRRKCQCQSARDPDLGILDGAGNLTSVRKSRKIHSKSKK